MKEAVCGRLGLMLDNKETVSGAVQRCNRISQQIFTLKSTQV